jgi:N-acetylglucosaminyldiphosphoundecaprenol N-acetyl-beta-D-mannosaminyltransferase
VRRVSVPLLRVQVTPLSAAAVAEQALMARRSGRRLVVGNLNLHGVYLYHTDPAFRAYCDDADLLVIDGWPIWLLARLRHGRQVPSDSRVGSTDWLAAALPRADREGLTILAIGSDPRTSLAAKDRMTAKYPGLRWIGIDGYRGVAALKDDQIAVEQPDLVLVGLGMPLQERWIQLHGEALRAGAVANVGACIDYLGGKQVLAPRWMGRVGMEWIFRLVADPVRLYRRYLFEPILLTWVLANRSGEALPRPR